MATRRGHLPTLPPLPSEGPRPEGPPEGRHVVVFCGDERMSSAQVRSQYFSAAEHNGLQISSESHTALNLRDALALADALYHSMGRLGSVRILGPRYPGPADQTARENELYRRSWLEATPVRGRDPRAPEVVFAFLGSRVATPAPNQAADPDMVFAPVNVRQAYMSQWRYMGIHPGVVFWGDPVRTRDVDDQSSLRIVLSGYAPSRRVLMLSANMRRPSEAAAYAFPWIYDTSRDLRVSVPLEDYVFWGLPARAAGQDVQSRLRLISLAQTLTEAARHAVADPVEPSAEVDWAKGPLPDRGSKAYKRVVKAGCVGERDANGRFGCSYSWGCLVCPVTKEAKAETYPPGRLGRFLRAAGNGQTK